MANKAFEIQESTLRIGGVDLQAGATTIVIPGVTQAVNYFVDEVDETGDQTYSNFPAESEVVVIDKALYDTIIAQGNVSTFADFTATTDDDGEIDEIEVNGQGTYSAANADRAGLNDMYAYVGTGSASDRPLDPNDWITIPFRPKMRAGEVENVGGGGGSTNELISDNENFTATLDNTGKLTVTGNANTAQVQAYTDNGDGYSTTITPDGVDLVWNGEETGGLSQGPGGLGVFGLAGKSVLINTDGGVKQWTFGTDGSLEFPDGTTQTTAYTGQTTSSGELYIMANIDGNIVTSTNGVDWNDPQPSGMVGISKVEIHNSVIVYTPGSEGPADTNGLFYSTELGTATVCTGTDVSTATGNDLFWNEVHYFSGPGKWVAVGYNAGTSYNFPVVAHSDNGITWTVVFVDDTFAMGFNTTESDWELRDVAWLDETNQYIITSNLNGSNFGGIFLTDDITTALDGTNHVAIAADTDEVAPWSVTGLGGPPGYVFLTEDDSGAVWFGYGSTVGNYEQDFDGIWADSFRNQIGYVPDISEVTYRNGSFIAVTPDGQVITPNVMGYTVSVPMPFTNTQISITNANPAVITYSSGLTPKADNEKIEITLAGEYNGTYYVNTNTNVLYTDLAMTTALDASGFAAFTSGTLTYSHGQFFDAAGVSNSYYYIGNDDEHIFRSSNGITWTEQANFTGEYFNDFAHGSWGSSSDANAVSYAPNDTDNWEDPAINTVQAALDELAARVTALQNFEIDGGNANTPALGEILIDGNGA